jgi:capsule polysaccharide export protein KpsE/RkpR
MITKLEAAIAQVEADLEQARSAGDTRRVASLEENLESRRQFLEMARRASADFS